MSASVNATLRGFTEVRLQWFLPATGAGGVQYVVSIRSGGVLLRRIFTLQTSVTVQELEPVTGYRFTVGSNATTVTVGTDVTTCQVFTVTTAAQPNGACLAISGYFLDINNVVRSCAEFSGVIDQASCLDSGLTVRDVELLPGYWRANLTTTEMFRCPQEQFCSPEIFGTEENATGTNIYCSPDHSGTFCQQCDDDLVLFNSGCESCDDLEGVTAYTGLIVAAAVFVVVVALFTAYMLSFMGGALCGWCSNGSTQPAHKPSKPSRKVPPKHLFDESDDEDEQASPGGQTEERRIIPVDDRERTLASLFRNSAAVKLRIAAGFFQVLLVYEVNFQRQQRSEAFAGVLDTLSFLCNLDFTVIFDGLGFRCVYDYRYYEFLVFVTAFPPALLLILLVLAGLAALCVSGNKFALGLGFISCMLVVLFLVYPFVCVAIFNTFVCQMFDGAEAQDNFVSALRADYTVDCNADDREIWVVYAGVMSAVYALGVICVFVLCTVFYQPTEGSMRGPLPFLTSPYHPGAYWYESYELARKLLMTSFIVLLQLIPTVYLTEVLLLSAQNINILAIVVLSYVSPYRDPTDFWLALLSLILLVPLIQYSLLDPYGDTLTDVVEVIVYVELGLLVLFIPLGACIQKTQPRFLTRKEAKEVEAKLSPSYAEAKGSADDAKEVYRVGIPPAQPQSQRKAQTQFEAQSGAKKLNMLDAERAELHQYKSENESLKNNLAKLKLAQSSPLMPSEVNLYKREKHISEMEAELKGSEARLLTAELEITEMERDVHKRQANVYKMMNESLQKDVALFQSENDMQSEELKFFEEENMRLKTKVEEANEVVEVDVELEEESDESEAEEEFEEA